MDSWFKLDCRNLSVSPLSPKVFCLGKGKELIVFPVSPVSFCQFKHCLMGQITRAGYYCVTAQQGWWVLRLPLHSDVRGARGSAQRSCKFSLVYLLQNRSWCVFTRVSVHWVCTSRLEQRNIKLINIHCLYVHSPMEAKNYYPVFVRLKELFSRLIHLWSFELKFLDCRARNDHFKQAPCDSPHMWRQLTGSLRSFWVLRHCTGSEDVGICTRSMCYIKNHWQKAEEESCRLWALRDRAPETRSG